MSVPYYSAGQCAEAIDRELTLRRRVYPRQVAEGKMTQVFADRQIAIFEQIKLDYATRAVVEQLF